MSGLTLYLAVLSVAGLAGARLALKLAPLPSELPAVTLGAALLSGWAAAVGLGAAVGPGWIQTVAAVIGTVVIVGPLLALTLVRAGRWRAAKAFYETVLLRTPGGRAALARWLSQAALAEGDTESALALAPERDPLLLSYAHLQAGEWQEALREAVLSANALEAKPSSVAPAAAALPAAVKVEALLELGRWPEAEAEIRRLRAMFDASGANPVAYRLLVLSEARLAAAGGEVERVTELLSQPLVGAQAWTLYEVLGRASERRGQADAAARAYLAAHAAAKGAVKARLAHKLADLGIDAAAVHAAAGAASASQRFVPLGTYALGATLALAYLGQLLLDRTVGLVRVLGQVYESSTLVAAYLQGLPGLTTVGAWWRTLSYAFVHGNLVHIGFNLWVLFDIGRIFERRRGWGELLAAFAVGTASGALLTGYVQAGQPLALVGASGGVLGVAGALLADAMARRDQADRALFRSLLQWMAFMVLFSLAIPGVSLWGHVGGVLGGFAYAYLRAALGANRVLSALLGAAAAAVMLGALGTGLYRMLPLLP